MALPRDRRMIHGSMAGPPAGFSEELCERVTGLYGTTPTIDFVDLAQMADNTSR